MKEPVRVGTRRSALARAQTGLVIAGLARHHRGRQFEAVPIETSGDRPPIAGESPEFTDAIDRALLDGTIDLAVHSAKDLPAQLPAGLALVACPRRANPRDCLVARGGRGAPSLPRGGRVGSSSLRRRAQLLRWRPDLTVVEIRGNVDTRLETVRSGRIDAAILAVAGLTRLARQHEISSILPTSDFLPAPAQGALAVVARSEDRASARLGQGVDHPSTRACVLAERAFSSALGGDCRVPLAALAVERAGRLGLVGEVLSLDGRTRLRARGAGTARGARSLGHRLGRMLADRGALELTRGARV